MKDKTVHIISHTHWDREWYINSPFVNEWLPVFFDALFAMMEREPQYRFVLDGQISMLDDCYGELEKLGRSTGEFKEKIRKYAGEGRLILGPYYLQPDWQLVSGESLIRNMIYGHEMAAELGGCMTAGWLLDNFGQISQAPQIHALFGMSGIFVWRGVELEPGNFSSEFWWKSPDGTTMLSCYLLGGYRNAMRLAEYPQIMNRRIQNAVEKISPFSRTGHMLLLNGYDQETSPDDILPYIGQGKCDFGDCRVIQSTPDEYLNMVREKTDNLPELEGALYSGRYISVFPGTLSSRMYLKQINDRCQQMLEQYVEPLYAMGSLWGMEYPGQEIDMIWKKLLKNHAHDSICGVSVDAVHGDMEQRFEEVGLACDRLIKRALDELAGIVDTSGFHGAEGVYTIFNTLLFPRTEVVYIPCQGRFQVRDEMGKILKSHQLPHGLLAELTLPAAGGCSVGLYPGGAKEEKSERGYEAGRKIRRIENSCISVVIHLDGTIHVTDKKTGRQYKNLGMLEDCADCGDEYNASFLEYDIPLCTAGRPAEICFLEEHELRTVVKISREWELPEALSANRQSRSETLRNMPVVTYVTIEKDSPLVKFRTVMKNICKDHRVRVLFPTEIKTEYSFAQTQFDITRHPVIPEEHDDSEIPEHVKRIVIGARESKAGRQFPQYEFVALSDGAVGAAVLNKGLPEYEILSEDSTIAVTLFRSVDWLARTDLNTRVGDAGPEIFVPDAQCIRRMEFEYAFLPFEGKVEENGLVSVAQRYHTPVITGENAIHVGACRSWMSACLEGESNIRVTSFQKSRKTDDIQIRLYHAGVVPAKADIAFLADIDQAFLVNPLGEKWKDLDIWEKRVEFTINPKQILTMQVKTRKHEADFQPVSYKPYTEPVEEIDFSAYKELETTMEADVERERVRAEELEKQYLKKKREYQAYRERLKEREGTIDYDAVSAALFLDMNAFRRAYLEARLSAIYTKQAIKKRYCNKEPEKYARYKEQLIPELRKISYQLNQARIDKRVGEYILEDCMHQEMLNPS